MKINISDDFDPVKIIRSGQCFRPAVISDDTYRFISGEKILYIRSLDDNAYDLSCSENEFGYWKDYFDLDLDYKALREKVPKDDAFLYKCAEHGKGLRILKQDKWEMLVSFIISQRKSIPAIRTSIEKLCLNFGERIKDDKSGDRALYAFPTPEALAKASKEELDMCSLGYRSEYVMDAARLVAGGIINPNELDGYDNEKLFETLKTVKGVGDKVANCVMLFAYHRLSRAPVDTWIAKIIDKYYDGDDPFPSYGEYAGLMQQYMFFEATDNGL